MNTTSTSTSTPKTSRRLVAGLVAGGVALAGIASAVTMTLATPTAHAASVPSASSSSTAGGTHTSSGSSTGGSGTGGSSTHRHHHSTPAVTPSATIKKLQQELGSLNYYEGPINGYLTTSTVQAIENLQAAAGLPQTGIINAATQQALDYQLAHGDNQMGGNTNTPASASIAKLQSELGRLNYYEGSDSGHLNAGTIHAIEYLQRSAGLPQTGSMNAATSHALAYQLVHGDNQMAG